MGSGTCQGVWHGGTVTQRHSTFPSESPWKISCHLHLVKCLQGLQAFCRLFWQGRQEGKQTDLSIHQENESQLWRSGRSLNVCKKKRKEKKERLHFSRVKILPLSLFCNCSEVAIALWLKKHRLCYTRLNLKIFHMSEDLAEQIWGNKGIMRFVGLCWCDGFCRIALLMRLWVNSTAMICFSILIWQEEILLPIQGNEGQYGHFGLKLQEFPLILINLHGKL